MRAELELWELVWATKKWQQPAIKCRMCKTSSSLHKNQLNPENNATISSLAFDFSESFLSLLFSQSIIFFSSSELQRERLIFHFHTQHNTTPCCLSVYKTLNCFSSPLFSSARESVFFLITQFTNGTKQATETRADSWELQHLKASKTHF